MSTRRRAREVAMQALYQYDLNRDTTSEDTERFIRDRLRYAGLEDYCLGLVAGVLGKSEALRAAISQAAAHWSIERMAPIDRNILRLAVYELTHAEAPMKVAINEAIEMCKRFSTTESAAFVNGILDTIGKTAESAHEPAPEPEAAELTNTTQSE